MAITATNFAVTFIGNQSCTTYIFTTILLKNKYCTYSKPRFPLEKCQGNP